MITSPLAQFSTSIAILIPQKKTLVQYPQENTSGGTTSGNVSKYTNNTWNQLLTKNL